jgi:hypothetical protein
MNAAQRAIWKSEVLVVLKAYLTEKLAYPDCSNDEIMAELPNMWRLLDEKGLVKTGMNYAWFHSEAQAMYMKAEINRITGFWSI